MDRILKWQASRTFIDRIRDTLWLGSVLKLLPYNWDLIQNVFLESPFWNIWRFTALIDTLFRCGKSLYLIYYIFFADEFNLLVIMILTYFLGLNTVTISFTITTWLRKKAVMLTFNQILNFQRKYEDILVGGRAKGLLMDVFILCTYGVGLNIFFQIFFDNEAALFMYPTFRDQSKVWLALIMATELYQHCYSNTIVYLNFFMALMYITLQISVTKNSLVKMKSTAGRPEDVLQEREQLKLYKEFQILDNCYKDLYGLSITCVVLFVLLADMIVFFTLFKVDNMQPMSYAIFCAVGVLLLIGQMTGLRIVSQFYEGSIQFIAFGKRNFPRNWILGKQWRSLRGMSISVGDIFVYRRNIVGNLHVILNCTITMLLSFEKHYV